MKSTTKRIKLDRKRLVGFDARKAGHKAIKAMVGGKIGGGA